ncbi:MAG: sigma-70 family RNA polymerase sigma factor [Planctomycetes bacterium]|nr:sigma-70 family RNA polymerase sigma factor [Planctomycetota bacterium]MBI3845264.1 sigma-70 family RNA polymerase sigma factor [Planctomycetota bacterium]
MALGEPTCWTVVMGAAAGRRADRNEFARRYEPVIRAYFCARWSGSGRRSEIDDAVQDVFVECFKAGGALERVDSDRPGGFRSFLFGIIRNVAARFDAKNQRGESATTDSVPSDLESSETSLSRVFDRAWARALVREAAALYEARAGNLGDDAHKRVEILRLRFREDMPIREIAKLWGEEVVQVHREYARARIEFKDSLMEVIAFQHPHSRKEAERECDQIIQLLS